MRYDWSISKNPDGTSRHEIWDMHEGKSVWVGGVHALDRHAILCVASRCAKMNVEEEEKNGRQQDRPAEFVQV